MSYVKHINMSNHATLNLDEYNVFMSLFLDYQLIPK
jgi:hypothetical protein